MAGRILLVGGSGRVGRLLMAVWPRTGPDLVVQHRAAPPQQASAPVLAWDLVADGPAPLVDWVRAHGGLEAMVLLAGVTPAPGVSEAALAGNTQIAMAAIDGARAAGIPRVLVASSSAVYGAGRGTPLAEEAALGPVNAYGRAKIEMERLCQRAPTGMAVTCLRIGNVAGADALLLSAEKAQAPLVLDQFEDGAGPVRSYVGPETLARLLAELALYPADLPGVLNIAARAPVAMADLLVAAGTPWRWRPAPETALQRITLDCTRLAALAGLSAQESTAEEMVRQWRLALRDRGS